MLLFQNNFTEIAATHLPINVENYYPYFGAVLLWIIKAYARFALTIYCPKLVVNQRQYLKIKGPILFAANHPNSFLDGIILTTFSKQPVYSLARGDAFKNKKYEALLRWLRLLPVYRTSEGVENLGHNYATFAACKDIFARGGIVLIFSEGRCINEWHLRPLKKGTARLAISAWQAGQHLIVIPLGFNYSSFRTVSKTVHLNFGSPLNKEDILCQPSEGRQLIQFNQQLHGQLSNLVYEIPGDNYNMWRKYFKPPPVAYKIVLSLPALAGFLLHYPLYIGAKKITDHYFNNDHYDSVLASLLMLGYVIYWPLLIVVSTIAFGWEAGVTAFVAIPFSAWAFVQVKPERQHLSASADG